MPDPEPQSRQSAVLRALARVLRPIARLLIAGGVPFQAASESLKRAYVEAARRHYREDAKNDSRLALLTGLNRKEIRRLTTPSADEWGPESVTSYASAVFTAWIQRPEWLGTDGKPRALPRRGEASFDTLARSVTLDMRPASILDELVRLGYAKVGEDDLVVVQGDEFTSRREFADRLGPLAENLQDHADAAVENVLANATPSPHLERSLFADELSPESAAKLEAFSREKWKELHDAFIAKADELEAEDRAHARPASMRVRVGLYGYAEPSAPAADPKESDE